MSSPPLSALHRPREIPPLPSRPPPLHWTPIIPRSVLRFLDPFLVLLQLLNRQVLKVFGREALELLLLGLTPPLLFFLFLVCPN